MQVTKGGTYKQVYKGFRGVDFTTAPTDVDGSRSPNAVNMITDLQGVVERRTGWEAIPLELDGKILVNENINGVHEFVNTKGEKRIFLHIKNSLYLYKPYDENGLTRNILYGIPNVADYKMGSERPITSMQDNPSVSFMHTMYDKHSNPLSRLYILDGNNYYVVCEDYTYANEGYYIMLATGTDFEDKHIAYVPNIRIKATSSGGGESFEPVNLLSDFRGNSFYVRNEDVATDAEPTFKLADTNIEENGIVRVTNNEITLYDRSQDDANHTLRKALFKAISWTNGTVQFNKGKIHTYKQNYKYADGQDNLYICYEKKVTNEDDEQNTSYKKRIFNCTIVGKFVIGNDERIFLSGNKNYPNMDWYCGIPDNSQIANPLYFPDTYYNIVGDEKTKIMGYVNQYNNMVVVKESNGVDPSLYYRGTVTDANGDTGFTTIQGTSSVGAIAKGSFNNLLDDCIFLTNSGVFGLDSNSVTQQKTAQNRSYFINKKLMAEPNLDTAVSCVCKNNYYLFVNDHCYVADGFQRASNNEGSSGYEWQYWELGLNDAKVNCCSVINDTVYFGTTDGRFCKFKDKSKGMKAYSDEDFEVLETDEGFETTVTIYKPYTSRWSTKEDTLNDASSYKKILKQNIGILTFPQGKSYAKIYYKDDKEKKVQNLDQTYLIDTTPKQVSTQYVYSASNDIDREILTNTDFDFNNIDFDDFSFGDYATSKFIPTKKKYRKAKKFQIIIEADGDKSIGTNFGISEIHLKYKVKGRIKR